MCGRYTETLPKPEIISRFQVAKDLFQDFKASYNVAPTQTVPVITRDNLNELHGFRWGLIPSWAKDPSIGNHMINARAETITEKMSFKVPFKWRRCLIPADGFYEWKQEGGGKIPMYIHRVDRAVFALAGLWSSWTEPGGSEICSCTIITTEANEIMKSIHDRMPVILEKEDETVWLNPNTEEKVLLNMLCPASGKDLLAREVSKKVNDPGNDYPELLEAS